VAVYDLVDAGSIATSDACQGALGEIEACIRDVVWPPGASEFTIYPESGKKRGEGNGVKPIKDAFAALIASAGWSLEEAFPVETAADAANFGAMDASKFTSVGLAVVEWETGNVSSSHRAMNKLGIGLIGAEVAIGVLIVPTVPFAKFLTDRIGNLKELLPYFPLWNALPIENGLLRVYAVQHDAESTDVPRIKKGTDGRAQS